MVIKIWQKSAASWLFISEVSMFCRGVLLVFSYSNFSLFLEQFQIQLLDSKWYEQLKKKWNKLVPVGNCINNWKQVQWWVDTILNYLAAPLRFNLMGNQSISINSMPSYIFDRDFNLNLDVSQVDSLALSLFTFKIVLTSLHPENPKSFSKVSIKGNFLKLVW